MRGGAGRGGLVATWWVRGRWMWTRPKWRASTHKLVWRDLLPLRGHARGGGPASRFGIAAGSMHASDSGAGRIWAALPSLDRSVRGGAQLFKKIDLGCGCSLKAPGRCSPAVERLRTPSRTWLAASRRELSTAHEAAAYKLMLLQTVRRCRPVAASRHMTTSTLHR